MKPIKKKTAKLFIILIAVAAVIATLFTFVPMHFGATTFTSVVSSINKSADLGGGVYAEYNFSDDYSENAINSSIETVKEVLAECGYSGASVFSVGGKKLRVEIGYPTAYGSLKDSYSVLRMVGIGQFELRSSSSEDDTYILGNKHISDVQISTYNSSIYAVLYFNAEGQQAYDDMLEASSTIYVYMGGNLMTSFSSSNITASSSMPLTFTSYASAEDFTRKVKLGSIDAVLDSKSVVINTTSSTNLTLILSLVAISVIVLGGLVFFAVKFGVMSCFKLLALLFDLVIVLFLVWAFPWAEISFSSLLAFAFGITLSFVTTYIYLSRVEEEYKQGKTVTASLESGYKKSFGGMLAGNIVLAVIFAIVAIVASGELKVFGLITCLFSLVSMFDGTLMLPGFVNIFEAFNDGGAKAYRFATREEKKDE
ncbi:MAG: hypothetical protein IJS74_01805 [Clostridia bacterium]|nr:hypothetical protein [Clostridia bacterium]